MMMLFCKRFRNKFGMTVILLIISIFLVSCTTEVTLTVKSDDSVDIRFEGGAGDAFTKMISSAAGVNSDANIIDADAVSYELAKAGFSNVKVEQNKDKVVFINMSDKKQDSYIFTSGIIKSEKGKLEDFYAKGDKVKAKVMDVNKDKWILKLNIKVLKLAEQQEEFEKYNESNDNTSATIGDIVGK